MPAPISSTRTEGAATIHVSPWSDDPAGFIAPSDIVSHMLASPALSSASSDPLLVDATNPARALSAPQYMAALVHTASLLEKRYGVRPGDAVCVFCFNDIYLPSTHIAILAAGGVVSPANVVYLPNELHHQLAKTRARVIITVPQQRDVVAAALAHGPNSVEHVVNLEDLVQEAVAASPYSDDDVRRAVARGPEHVGALLPAAARTLGPESHAYYCFSSGTSGVPKGVVTIHNNIVSNLQQQCFVMRGHYTRDKVFGGFLPMSHIYGLSQYIYAMPYIGLKTVLFPRFDLELVLRNIVKHKISFMHIVPPVAVLFAKSPLVDKYPEIRRSLVGLISGAAPLSRELATQVIDRLGCPLYQAYGLTETSPMTHIFSYDTDAYNVSSIGWLLPGMDARIVSEDGHDIATTNTPGELWLRGPNVMQGYLDNDEATAQAFGDEARTWFRTGDVVVVDASGQYFVVDRFKELIKSKGHQVAPAELEAVLLGHEHVADAAVTGFHVPHEGTELPRAFVVFKDGLLSDNTTPEALAVALKRWFDGRVSKHKRLWGGIVIVSEIPKSPSGKILRRMLRARENDTAYGYPLARSNL